MGSRGLWAASAIENELQQKQKQQDAHAIKKPVLRNTMRIKSYLLYYDLTKEMSGVFIYLFFVTY